MRRIGEILKLFCDSGIICLAAFISPTKKDRELVKSIIGKNNFIEVFIKCSLKKCETRDVKGFYKLARKGIINDYTGISSPYEEPEHPDLVLDTENNDINTNVNLVYNVISERLC